MTYRDRREAKADRLREWAAKREARAVADHERAEQMASIIPFGQPILVGHYSERADRNYRARISSTYERSFENLSKAQSMASRADGIEAQLDQSIYLDDPDAIQRLEERIAALEAERDRYRDHNRAHRGGKGCTCPLDCGCRSPYQPNRCGCHQHPLPGYVLTNLSANIRRNRDCLEQLKRQAQQVEHAEQAGGVAVETLASGYVSVTFTEKPALEVREALKGAGFRWAKGYWVGKAHRLPEGIIEEDM